MNTQTTAVIHYVAIDVSKATLQVQDDKRAFTVENNSIGHRKLLVHLKGCQKPLVVYPRFCDRHGITEKGASPIW